MTKTKVYKWKYTGTGTGLLMRSIVWMLTIIFTLGFGIPYVSVAIFKFVVNNLEVEEYEAGA